MTYKQVGAIVAIVLLIFLYVLTLGAAIGGFEGADRLFAASMGATLGMPILLWIYIWLYGKITGRVTFISKSNQQEITTIIFDIGNVLTDFRWNEFLKEKGYSDELIEKIASATVRCPDWVEYDRGILSEEEIMERFVKNDPSIEKEIREAFANVKGILTKQDYAIPWIKELKEKGYKVLYLSNFSRKVERECEEAMDFLPYMDGGILSYKDHCVKPELEIYQLLIERFQLEPETCVFLDDTIGNLDTAKKFGIKTILYKSQEQALKDLKALGVK